MSGPALIHSAVARCLKLHRRGLLWLLALHKAQAGATL